MLHAFSRGAVSLGIFRFLLGMGEAGNWPAAVKVVAEWFPESERAHGGGHLQQRLGVRRDPGAAGGGVHHAEVRLARGVCAGRADGAGMAGVLVAIYRTPEEIVASSIGSPACPPGDRQDCLSYLLRSRFVWVFTVSKIFMDPVWYFYIFWFPEYLKRARGFDLAAVGKYAWIPFLVAGSGNLLGGWMAAWLLRRGVSVTVARKGVVTFFAVLMTSGHSGRAGAGSVARHRAGVRGHDWVHRQSLANMLAMPADVFPKGAVASVFGLASMGSGFGGMLFTLITGWVVDHYSYTPVFFGFGVLPLICAAILWAFLGPLSGARERVTAFGSRPLEVAAEACSMIRPRHKPEQALNRLDLRVDPGLAVRPAQQAVGLFVAHDHALLGVPLERPAQLHRDVGQDAARRRDVALFDVGDRPPARGHVRQQVLHVAADGRAPRGFSSRGSVLSSGYCSSS